MTATHRFTLPSGVSCVVREMTGKHQRLLTEQKHKKFGDNLNEMLSDLLVEVGNKTSGFNTDFVAAMLSADRRYALAQARMFSVGIPDEDGKVKFEFTWDYVDHEGKDQQLPLVEDLTDGFPVEPFYKQWASYEEIEKDVLIELPSGLQVKFSLLDGFGEVIGGSTKRDERSSHTTLLMRRPRYMQKTQNDTVPVQMGVRDLDNLSYKDIEALRKAIKKHEGRVHTEMKFEHPEAEYKPQHEKYVIVDLLNVPAFFFPSEAI